MIGTLPQLVFISLERKDDPCKRHITLFEQMRDTFDLLVFISSERKNDPCKMGEKAGLQFYPCWKYEWHFTPFSVYFIREEGRPL